MNSQIQYPVLRKLLMHICIFACTIMLYTSVKAQEHPPKPITVEVSTLQHLSFGTFIQAGDFGTITVTPQQARTSTGSVIIPNMSSIVTAALFEVTALPGTLITIVNGPASSLGGNGGTVSLTIGDSSTGSPFIARDDVTEVFIGGMLTVGPLSANPAGNYSGTFTVTFIQQ